MDEVASKTRRCPSGAGGRGMDILCKVNGGTTRTASSIMGIGSHDPKSDVSMEDDDAWRHGITRLMGGRRTNIMGIITNDGGGRGGPV